MKNHKTYLDLNIMFKPTDRSKKMLSANKAYLDSNITFKPIDRLKIMLSAIEKIIWSNLETISPGISNANPRKQKAVKVDLSQAQLLEKSMGALLNSFSEQSKKGQDFLSVDPDNIKALQKQMSEFSPQLVEKLMTIGEAIVFVRKKTGGSYYNGFTNYLINSLYRYPKERLKQSNDGENDESTNVPQYRDDFESEDDFREEINLNRAFTPLSSNIFFYTSNTGSQNNQYDFKILGSMTLDWLSIFDLGLTTYLGHGIKVPIMNDLEFLNFYSESIREAFTTCLSLSSQTSFLAENATIEDIMKKHKESVKTLASLCYEFLEITKWKLENYHSYCLVTDKNYTIKDYITRMGMLGYAGGSELGKKIKQDILDNEYISCQTLIEDLVVYFSERMQKQYSRFEEHQNELRTIKAIIAEKIEVQNELEIRGSMSTNNNHRYKEEIKLLDESIEKTNKQIEESFTRKEQGEQELNQLKIKTIDNEHSLSMIAKF